MVSSVFSACSPGLVYLEPKAEDILSPDCRWQKTEHTILKKMNIAMTDYLVIVYAA